MEGGDARIQGGGRSMAGPSPLSGVPIAHGIKSLVRGNVEKSLMGEGIS